MGEGLCGRRRGGWDALLGAVGLGFRLGARECSWAAGWGFGDYLMPWWWDCIVQPLRAASCATDRRIPRVAIACAPDLITSSR
ncbi:hypothetical protein GCM10009741_03890 [Kribbella lupini]|uniref:Secreted protein n=1 Tax=Kribbella lupini TaxID=291602 RepID=A0ABP4KTH7_9ACTN